MDKLDLLKIAFEVCGAECEVKNDTLFVKVNLSKSKACFTAIFNDTFNRFEDDFLKKYFEYEYTLDCIEESYIFNYIDHYRPIVMNFESSMLENLVKECKNRRLVIENEWKEFELYFLKVHKAFCNSF